LKNKATFPFEQSVHWETHFENGSFVTPAAATIRWVCKPALIFWAMVLFPIAVLATGTPDEVLLWPDGAPGSEGKTNEEVVKIHQPTGDHVITSINKPSITIFLPAPDQATGAAVIIAPGGGHRELWMDHEGYNVAR
jgi:acetyl esterase/lipase